MESSVCLGKKEGPKTYFRTQHISSQQRRASAIFCGSRRCRTEEVEDKHFKYETLAVSGRFPKKAEGKKEKKRNIVLFGNNHFWTITERSKV